MKSSKPVVALFMKSLFSSPASIISRASPLARAMSLPTFIPSQTSANFAESVLHGSTAHIRAPFESPFNRWWKKIGWAALAFEPQRTIASASSTSLYEEVPPPAPNTVARPTTLGACQVRLQLSMLLDPITVRANFCAA